jgi:hypothetical protein
VEAALKEERSRKRAVLFPLRLDNGRIDAEKDWLVKLQKSRQIYDFCAWENWEAYYTQFNRLLGDLRTS